MKHWFGICPCCLLTAFMSSLYLCCILSGLLSSSSPILLFRCIWYDLKLADYGLKVNNYSMFCCKYYIWFSFESSWSFNNNVLFFLYSFYAFFICDIEHIYFRVSVRWLSSVLEAWILQLTVSADSPSWFSCRSFFFFNHWAYHWCWGEVGWRLFWKSFMSWIIELSPWSS